MAKAKTIVNKHGAKVGDTLTANWGYDQTNIEIFRVEKITPCGVYISAINLKGEVIEDLFREDGFHRTVYHTDSSYGVVLKTYGFTTYDPNPFETYKQYDSNHNQTWR